MGKNQSGVPDRIGSLISKLSKRGVIKEIWIVTEGTSGKGAFGGGALLTS